MYEKPLHGFLNYQWFRKMCRKPFKHLRNYAWLHKRYAERITGFTTVGFTAVLGIFLQTEVLFATLIVISFMIELYMIKLT
jgi:hypothetical protein